MDTVIDSQEGMERACREYCRVLALQTGDKVTLAGEMQARYEGCRFSERSLLLSFPVRPKLRNTMDVIHGGAMAGAMDITMGVLARYLCGGHMTPTIQMEVSFPRPAPVKGEGTGRLFVESVCHSCGRTMAYVTARAWLEDAPEKSVASATGIYYTA